jgi:hypothetical protein
MVNVKDKKCLYYDCCNRPNFNYEDQSKGLYCSEHKIPDMVDVRSKKMRT